MNVKVINNATGEPIEIKKTDKLYTLYLFHVKDEYESTLNNKVYQVHSLNKVNGFYELRVSERYK